MRLLLPFLAGIALEPLIKPEIPIWFYALGLSLLVYLFIHFSIRRWRFMYRFLPGLALTPLLIAAGGLLCAVQNPLRFKNHYVNQYRQDDLWVAQLTSVPVLREKSVRVEAEVIGIHRPYSQPGTTGKIILSFEADSCSRSLQTDDIIVVSSRIKSLPPPANPGEFNYAAFLQNRFIFRQAYVKKQDWNLIERTGQHSFIGYFLIWREFFIHQFRSHIEGQDEFSVLAALILGKTEFIEQEMMGSYASAGAIHILAVSGLHVGLIYVVIAPLLRRFFPGKTKRWLKFLIPSAILWLYAGVTGFSPSVLRAALMFTAFIAAETWERNSSSYNTIGISAFMLLCWNPGILNELGFQLSYLAVLGIIMFQKKISDALPLSNKWAQKIWQLSSVTLAAQITTFPLSIYYFHQFPVYFLFSNLIVIPVSTVLLYAGLAFLLACWVPHLSDVLANICASLTTCMNSIVQWFDKLPYSTLKGFSPGIFELVLLYGLMWSISVWLFWKKQRALVVSLGVVLMLFAIHLVNHRVHSNRNFCCIHSIRNHTCITVIIGDDAYLLSDTLLFADKQLQRMHLDNFLSDQNIDQILFVDINSDKKYADNHFRYADGILQTSEFTLGLWDHMPKDSTPISIPDAFLISELPKTELLHASQREVISTKKLILGISVTEGKAAFLIKNALDQSSVLQLKDGAVLLNHSGLVHHTARNQP